MAGRRRTRGAEAESVTAPAPVLSELVFIDVAEAVLLLVGWPKLTPAQRETLTGYNLMCAWADISLVEPEDAIAWYAPLVEAGAIAIDGTVHPQVQSVIKTRARRALLGNAKAAEQTTRDYLKSMGVDERAEWLAQNGFGAPVSDEDDE
jgi:hypothetical protein